MSNKCPECGAICGDFRNPFPTVDIIIRRGSQIAIIKRKNPPYGWALPGGFIDYRETSRDAAIREAKEETNLDVKNLQFFGVYDNPDRDPRAHMMSLVYFGEAEGEPKAQDDATEIRFIDIYPLLNPDTCREEDRLDIELAFDHLQIIEDFYREYF